MINERIKDMRLGGSYDPNNCIKYDLKFSFMDDIHDTPSPQHFICLR